jgi:hypothetical protein
VTIALSPSSLRYGAATLAAIAALLAAGCGSSSSSSDRVKTVSLSNAADVSSSAPGYQTDMTLHERVPGIGTISATANGSFSPASRLGALTMHMSLPSALGTGTLQMQMVLDKSTLYLKLPPRLSSEIPGGKPWVYINLEQVAQAAGLPGLGALARSSSSLSDPAQYLSVLRATSVGSVNDLGQATVNGVRTTHYSAEVDLSKLPDVVPASSRPGIEQLVTALEQKGVTSRMPIQAWIDSSNLIRRIQVAVSEPVANGQSLAISLTENFLEYGPQPAPAIPSPEESTNALSVLHAVG